MRGTYIAISFPGETQIMHTLIPPDDKALAAEIARTFWDAKQKYTWRIVTADEVATIKDTWRAKAEKKSKG